MFSGIIYQRGAVKSIDVAIDTAGTLAVDIAKIAEKKIGDSIAVNGVCLTIAKLENEIATFNISPETADKTLIGKWQVGDLVNLEVAATLQTLIGGHLVTGHIDGTCTLEKITDEGECREIQFVVDELKSADESKMLIAEKGSVALDGISLTVNSVVDQKNQTTFTVMAIPHTLANTNLGKLQPGAAVHLEVDLLARHVKRILDAQKNSAK